MLIAQINRGAMATGDKRPALWLLKSTGVLEEHADLVLLLHWDYFYSNKKEHFNDFEIIIAKHKEGITGTIKCNFYPIHYRFEEIEIDREFEHKTKVMFGIDKEDYA